MTCTPSGRIYPSTVAGARVFKAGVPERSLSLTLPVTPQSRHTASLRTQLISWDWRVWLPGADSAIRCTGSVAARLLSTHFFAQHSMASSARICNICLQVQYMPAPTLSWASATPRLLQTNCCCQKGFDSTSILAAMLERS